MERADPLTAGRSWVGLAHNFRSQVFQCNVFRCNVFRCHVFRSQVFRSRSSRPQLTENSYETSNREGRDRRHATRRLAGHGSSPKRAPPAQSLGQQRTSSSTTAWPPEPTVRALANNMRRSRVYGAGRHAPLMCSMIQDTLIRAAMSSLKVAAGAIVTGAMTVLLWVVVIEILA
jgi:hypothetical protein